MYIKKYWGNFIGGSDDSLNLVAFLEDQKKEEIPLSEIFAKIGLDKQNWDFRQTVEYLEFTHSDGVEMDFHFAIDVVTDLAAILLECSVSGSVNLQDLDEYNTPARRIRITATPEEHEAMDKALALDIRSQEQDMEIVRRVHRLAEKYGVKMQQIALAWEWEKGVTAPIIGATKASHFDDAAGAFSVKLTEEDIAFLEEPYVPHRIVGAVDSNPPEGTKLLDVKK